MSKATRAIAYILLFTSTFGGAMLRGDIVPGETKCENKPCEPPVTPAGSSCALGPHAPFRKLITRASGLPDGFAGVRTREKLVIDPAKIPAHEKNKDAAYAVEFYAGRGHVAVAPPEARKHALAIFDSVDVLNAIHELDLTGKMNLVQESFFSDLIRARAHGKYDWRTWDLAKLDPTGILTPFNLTAAKVDAALTEVTSLEYRPGIRIVPARKPGEKGYINPANVPSGPMLFFQGNRPIDEKTTNLVNLAVDRLFTPLEGQKTGGGIMFLSDVHAGRSTGEEANFLKMADILANHPPRKIVFGGDLLDAPSTGKLLAKMNEIIAGKVDASTLGANDRSILQSILSVRDPKRAQEPLTYEEQNAYRAEKFKYLLDYLSARVPNTEIIVQFGNHDLPRLDRLPRRDVKTGNLFDIPIAASEVPDIKLDSAGKLPKDWDVDFKARLREVMLRRLARPVILAQIDRATPQQMVEFARQFYQLKGLNKDPKELTEFNYYDEKVADIIRDHIADNPRISFLGRRSDKYFRLNVGTEAAPIWTLITHEPQDQGPNMDRVDPAKPSVFGGQSKWGDEIRAVVNFDRHAAATIASQSKVLDGTAVVDAEPTADGKFLAPRAFHVIGSFTGNSNAGQNMMAAVMETDAEFGAGNVYHITFAGADGQPTTPTKAKYRQVQWVKPHFRTDAPDALSSTTVNPVLGGLNSIDSTKRAPTGRPGNDDK